MIPPGRPKGECRIPQGEGRLTRAAGPLPRRSHRSPQGEGRLTIAARWSP
jgi:hypothetical protein